MKEKLKTIAIIILLIISLILILGCKSKYILFFPGHSIRSISVIEKDYEMFSDQFELADSMFNDKYKFPLTR